MVNNIPHIFESYTEQFIDLYTFLLKDRIIFVGDGIDTAMSNSIIGQMLYLESKSDDEDIRLYINSDGGAAQSTFAIYDTMRYIKSPIRTVCLGEVCSGASLLLAAGDKGKRIAMRNSIIMIHEPSSVTAGGSTDIDIYARQLSKLKDRLAKEFSELTGQSKGKVLKDIERDCFMSPLEAKDYGIVDVVL